jgi:hypothetical protein
MRLKWTPLNLTQLVADLAQQPDSVIYCAQSTLGPTRLVLLEFAVSPETQHFDEIDAWLAQIETKIQAIEALRATDGSP